MTSESGRRERWAAMRAAMVALKAELRAEWAWYRAEVAFIREGLVVAGWGVLDLEEFEGMEAWQACAIDLEEVHR